MQGSPWDYNMWTGSLLQVGALLDQACAWAPLADSQWDWSLLTPEGSF